MAHIVPPSFLPLSGSHQPLYLLDPSSVQFHLACNQHKSLQLTRTSRFCGDAGNKTCAVRLSDDKPADLERALEGPQSSARDGPAKTDLLDLRPSSPNPPRGKARAKARWTDPAAAEWLRSRAGQTSAGELRSRDGELDLRRTPGKRQQDCTENKSSAPSPRAGAQRAGAPLELGGPRAPNKKLTSGSFTL